MSIESLEKNFIKKLVVVFYFLFFGGGVEVVCFWILEVLKEIYDLILFIVFDVDFDKFNFMYGI